MNPMLQRHCAKFIYIVPDGLKELMSDISREVIRTQPEQVYTFIADYLDALMITRENARIAARLVDGICEIAETTVDLLLRTGMSREAANEIVAVIQAAFRAYLERKKKLIPSKEAAEVMPAEEEAEADIEVVPSILEQIELSPDQFEEVASIIQHAWHKFKEKQEREKKMLFGMVDWRIAARSAIMLYRKTGVTMYEANRAATLIKAAYKGYYTRRIMRRLLHMGLDEESTVQAGSSAEDRTEEDIQQPGEIDDYLQQIYSIEEDYISDKDVGYIEELGEDAKGRPVIQKRQVSPRRRVSHRRSKTRGSAGTPKPSEDTEPAVKGTKSLSVKTATPDSQGQDISEPVFTDEEIPPTEEVFTEVEASFSGEGQTESTVPIDESEKAPPPPNTEQEAVSEPIEVDEIPADDETPAETVETPAETVEMPAETVETPAETAEAPVEIAESPAPEELFEEPPTEPASEPVPEAPAETVEPADNPEPDTTAATEETNPTESEV